MIFRLDACSSTLSTRSDRSSTFSPSPRRPQIKSASFGPATTAVRPWRLSRWSRSPAQAADRAHRTACRPALQRDARRGLDLLGGRQLGRHDPDRLLLVRPPPPSLVLPSLRNADAPLSSARRSAGFHSLYLSFAFALAIDCALQAYQYFLVWRFRAFLRSYNSLKDSRVNGASAKLAFLSQARSRCSSLFEGLGLGRVDEDALTNTRCRAGYYYS